MVFNLFCFSGSDKNEAGEVESHFIFSFYSLPFCLDLHLILETADWEHFTFFATCLDFLSFGRFTILSIISTASSLVSFV